MFSSKSYILLALVCLCVLGIDALRIARETEKEGVDSNDVNSRDTITPSGQDTPANPMAGADDDDDDEGDWDNDDGQGFYISWRPFQHSFQDMFAEFRRMESVMREMQDRIYNLTMSVPNNYDNSTSDIITINGKRYNVTRTVHRTSDNNTSFLFSATSLVPVDKRRKRAAPLLESMAEELHRKKRGSGHSDESDTEEDDG